MCYLGQLTKPKAGYLDSNSEKAKDCRIFRRLTVRKIWKEPSPFWLAHPTLIPSTFQLIIIGTSSADEFLAHTDRFPSEKCSRSSQSFGCCLHETRLRVAHFPFRQLNRRGRIQGGPAELYELFGASDGNQLACSPSTRVPPRIGFRSQMERIAV